MFKTHIFSHTIEESIVGQDLTHHTFGHHPLRVLLRGDMGRVGEMPPLRGGTPTQHEGCGISLQGSCRHLRTPGASFPESKPHRFGTRYRYSICAVHRRLQCVRRRAAGRRCRSGERARPRGRREHQEHRDQTSRTTLGAQRRTVLTDLKVIKPSGKFAEVHPHVLGAFEGFQRMTREIAQGLTAWHPRDALTHAAGVQEALDEATEELSLASQRLQEATEDIRLEDSPEDRIVSLLGDRVRGEVRTLSDLTGVGVGGFQDFMARGPEGYRYFSDLLHSPLEELPDEVPPVLYIPRSGTRRPASSRFATTTRRAPGRNGSSCRCPTPACHGRSWRRRGRASRTTRASPRRRPNVSGNSPAASCVATSAGTP
jgi:hypothetical protein